MNNKGIAETMLLAIALSIVAGGAILEAKGKLGKGGEWANTACAGINVEEISAKCGNHLEMLK